MGAGKSDGQRLPPGRYDTIPAFGGWVGALLSGPGGQRSRGRNRNTGTKAGIYQVKKHSYMVSSIYSGPLNLRMSTDSVKLRQNYLGPDKTCLRSIRDVFDCIFNVCGTILKHFLKKFIKKYWKFSILDLRFWKSLNMVLSVSNSLVKSYRNFCWHSFTSGHLAIILGRAYHMITNASERFFHTVSGKWFLPVIFLWPLHFGSSVWAFLSKWKLSKVSTNP